MAEDNVILGKATGTIYACGDRMRIFAKSKSEAAPAVAIVGQSHEAMKGF